MVDFLLRLGFPLFFFSFLFFPFYCHACSLLSTDEVAILERESLLERERQESENWDVWVSIFIFCGHLGALTPTSSFSSRVIRSLSKPDKTTQLIFCRTHLPEWRVVTR